MTPAVFDDIVRHQAAVRPELPAVVDATTALTYRQLDGQVGVAATTLAGILARTGAAPGARVVLVADSSVDHLVTALAVWRVGAVLVTIYPSSTERELSYALDNARPALVVAGANVREVVGRVAQALGLPVTGLPDAHPASVPAPDGRMHAATDPHAVAMICYTSGSTSRPKAVMHTHAGLLAAAQSYARVWHLEEGDTALVALPLAWAFGLVTTSMATLVGGGLVLLLRRADPDVMVRALNERGVTFLAGVTTMFVKLVAELEAEGSPARAGPHRLRLCISGGEPRNDAAFARWRDLTGCPVHDVYAASEAFPLVTYDPVVDPEPRPGAAGRVVAGASLRIIGADGRDAPPGRPGEAWARTPALMTGYWRDPELTAAALTPDGWYRTGDLVEVDGDGYVHVVGRLSDLIIRGGSNVSPAEVEAVLLGHPAVQEAAVVGLPDPDYGEQVVAAVVLAPAAPAAPASGDPDELRSHCALALAGYKVPTRVVPVPQLPRNANTGKVQRRDVAALLTDLLTAAAAAEGDRP